MRVRLRAAGCVGLLRERGQRILFSEQAPRRRKIFLLREVISLWVSFPFL